MTHQFIAIEGPIGVGKTTVARQLAEAIKGQYLPDTDIENPYLATFYRDPKSAALHTQMHFLASRGELLSSPAVFDLTQAMVADFMIDKDRLFAELTLDENEWWMYSRVYENMVAATRRPDLVVYLQAPLERLIERIERRGIRHEQRIDSNYLLRLGQLYERFFHEYTESSLLIVNTAEVNLADNQHSMQALIDRIRQMDGGRHYWNPAAS